MLAEDKDARGPRARPCYLGTVLVLMVAVEEVRVAGLFVGRVDRHPLCTRLLKVEYALRPILQVLSSCVVYTLRTSVAGSGAGVNGERTSSAVPIIPLRSVGLREELSPWKTKSFRPSVG